MDKDALKKTVNALDQKDIHDIITIEAPGSGQCCALMSILAGCSVHRQYEPWINTLAKELNMKEIFLEYFYPHEIDLPSNATETEMYNKLAEILENYLAVARKLVT